MSLAVPIAASFRFTNGMVERDGKLYLYYGAADECIGVTAFDREALVRSVTRVEA